MAGYHLSGPRSGNSLYLVRSSTKQAKTTTIIGNTSQKPVNMVIQFDYLTIWPELLDKVYTKKSKKKPTKLFQWLLAHKLTKVETKKTRLCPRGSSIDSHTNRVETTDSKCRSTKSKDDDIVIGDEILARLSPIDQLVFEIFCTANSWGKSIFYQDTSWYWPYLSVSMTTLSIISKNARLCSNGRHEICSIANCKPNLRKIKMKNHRLCPNITGDPRQLYAEIARIISQCFYDYLVNYKQKC
jgi:hypothetical protein